MMLAESRKSVVVLTVLVGACVACWIAFAEPSRSGTWVLGLYRTRWFLLAVGLSYFTFWLGIRTLFALHGRTVLRLALVHFAVLSAFGLLEVASMVGLVDFRALWQSPDWNPARELRLRRVSRPGLDWEGWTQPDLARTLGIPADPVHVSLATDAHGLRNPPGKGDPAVFCLGDSILAARLLPIEEILSERLQALLEVEVLNVSESTYSPQEELIRLEQLGADLGGKLVLHFIFEGNDLADSSLWREWCERPFESSWPQSGLMSVLLESLKWAHAEHGSRRVGRFGTQEDSPEDVYFLYDGRSVERSMTELPELASTITDAARKFGDAGTHYAVVFVPMKITVLHPFCRWPDGSDLASPEAGTSGFQAALERVCSDQGIPFFDLTGALREVAASGRLPYFTHDTHPNSAGHRAMAEALAPWVRELRGP